MVPSDEADAADVHATLGGDGAAFARIVGRHQGALAAQLWRFTRDRGTLEELVQNAFVEAYRSLAGWRGEAPFGHWLRAVATRAGFAHWKAEERRRRHEARVVDERDGAVDEVARAVARDEATRAGELLYGLLARLGPEDRLVLTLRYYEDLPVAEVAARMGWNGALTKVRAFRARRRLRALLERERLLERL